MTVENGPVLEQPTDPQLTPEEPSPVEAEKELTPPERFYLASQKYSEVSTSPDFDPRQLGQVISDIADNARPYVDHYWVSNQPPAEMLRVAMILGDLSKQASLAMDSFAPAVRAEIAHDYYLLIGSLNASRLTLENYAARRAAGRG